MMVLHGMSVPHREGREGDKERGRRRQKGEREKGGRKRETLDLGQEALCIKKPHYAHAG